MKISKVIFVSLLIIASGTQAQSSFQISLSPGYFKSKDAKGFSIDAIGINLTASRPITERLFISLSTGYYDFLKNKEYEKIREFVPSPREEFDFLVPFRLSGKYFVGNNNFNPYLTVEWAVNYLSRDLYIPEPYPSPFINTSNDKSFHPSLGIGMGVLINITESLNADIMFVGHTGKIIGQFILFQAGINYSL